jgi:hypothetical protein
MFTTGFTMNPVKVAESMQGKTGRMDAKLWRKPKSSSNRKCSEEDQANYYNQMHFSFRKYSL